MGGIVLFVDSLRFVWCALYPYIGRVRMRLRCMMCGVLTVDPNVCLTSVRICWKTDGLVVVVMVDGYGDCRCYQLNALAQQQPHTIGTEQKIIIIIIAVVVDVRYYVLHTSRGKKGGNHFFIRPSLFAGLCGDKDRIGKKYEKCTETVLCVHSIFRPVWDGGECVRHSQTKLCTRQSYGILWQRQPYL